MNKEELRKFDERVQKAYEAIKEATLSTTGHVAAHACMKYLAHHLVWECEDDNDLYGAGCYFGSVLRKYEDQEIYQLKKQNEEIKNEKERSNSI